MNRDTVGSILVGLLCAAALLSLWLSVRWFFSVREMQQLQVHATQVNNTRAAAQSLANEAIVYSRKNPAIEPILQEFNLRPKEGATNQAGTSPLPK